MRVTRFRDGVLGSCLVLLLASGASVPGWAGGANEKAPEAAVPVARVTAPETAAGPWGSWAAVSVRWVNDPHPEVYFGEARTTVLQREVGPRKHELTLWVRVPREAPVGGHRVYVRHKEHTDQPVVKLDAGPFRVLARTVAEGDERELSGGSCRPPVLFSQQPPHVQKQIARAGLDLPVGPRDLDDPGQPSTFIPEDPPAEQEDVPAITFFGTEIKPETASIVYVIDTSGSMATFGPTYWEPPTKEHPDGLFVPAGTRLMRVKGELASSISRLPSSFHFNVVAFDCGVSFFRNELVKADPDNKKAAIGWAMGLQPGGGTGTGPAVAAALERAPSNKTLIALSDGDPNCIGPDDKPADVHREMIRTHNTQKAAIHTVGVGLGDDARKFMQAVASDSGGTFREVY